MSQESTGEEVAGLVVVVAVILLGLFVWWAFKTNNPSGKWPSFEPRKSEEELCEERGGVWVRAYNMKDGRACISRDALR